MIQNVRFAHDAIDRRLRFRGESLLGKDGHNLAGCEISKV